MPVASWAERPSDDNPLGRILAVSRSELSLDSEALELRLDEAVLKETSDLERYLWLVKTVSVVAPLLGLGDDERRGYLGEECEGQDPEAG